MKRSMIVAIAGGAVVVLLAWYFLLWAPASSDLDTARQAVAQGEAQKQSLEATVARLTEIANNAPQLQATLRRLDASIPETPDLADFIIQANVIAAESGIDWLSISPAPPVAGIPVTTISVSMNVQGGFFQVLDYLNRLEDLERLVIVDTVNISSESQVATDGQSSSTTGSPTLNVSLAGRMFTRSAPPAVPGAPSSDTTPTTLPAGSTSATTLPSSSTTATTATTKAA